MSLRCRGVQDQHVHRSKVALTAREHLIDVLLEGYIGGEDLSAASFLADFRRQQLRCLDGLFAGMAVHRDGIAFSGKSSNTFGADPA
jgi:hypothetical protein